MKRRGFLGTLLGLGAIALSPVGSVVGVMPGQLKPMNMQDEWEAQLQSAIMAWAREFEFALLRGLPDGD